MVRFRLAAITLATALIGCVGCVAGHQPPASREFYKLVDIDSQYFLLPPSSTDTESHQTIQIPFGTHERSTISEKDCSIHGTWFSLYPAAEHWTGETPIAKRWEESGGTVDMKAEWSKFLAELSARQQQHCFASADELASIKRTMIESMAMPADESLFYRYSYGPGGYVDLIPGMELKIERNLFADAAGGQQNTGNYRGTITTYYSVFQNESNSSQLKLIRQEGDYKKLSASVANLPDTTLAAKFETSSHLRLLLQSLAVTADIKSPAVLLGSRDTDILNEATRTFVNDPKMSCNRLGQPQLTCVDFDGIVTVSPMLKIAVNRHATYVPLGSRVWIVFPASARIPRSDLLKTLRIRRLYEGKYIDVQFARNEQDVGQILLFEGDEISWSAPR